MHYEKKKQHMSNSKRKLTSIYRCIIVYASNNHSSQRLWHRHVHCTHHRWL